MCDQQVDGFFFDLKEILDQKFTGQIILNVSQGTVANYEKRERLRPNTGKSVNLTETLQG